VSEVACETPPAYTPGTLESVQWHAVAGIHERQYMALTGDDYKSLARNGVTMEKALRQSHSRTVHYRGCIERHNAQRHKNATDDE
jgi:glutamate-1-semialdehyde aminotransferase